MIGWEEIKFGDIATFRNGLNFNNKSHGLGCKIIGIPDFGDRLIPDYNALGEIIPDGIVKEDDYLKKGDLIFVRSNGNKSLVGRSLYINQDIEKLVYSGFCIRARTISENAFPLFFAYFFRTPLFRQLIAGAAGGANIQNLNQGILSRAVVPFPPLSIQKHITSILSAYDDLIENNINRIRLLKELVQRTYAEWFVKFRVDGKQLEVDEKTGLPNGWEKISMVNIASFLNGFAFKPSDWLVTGLPIIKIKELKSGIGSETPRNDGSRVPKKFLIKSGDILFSWSGSLEVVIWQGEDGWLNQHLFKVKPINGISREFVHQALYYALTEFNSLTTGSTMKHIKRQELDFVKVSKPTESVMKAFTDIINPIQEQILNLSKQNRLLKESRDILLPRLFSGIIEVEELEDRGLAIAVESETLNKSR